MYSDCFEAASYSIEIDHEISKSQMTKIKSVLKNYEPYRLDFLIYDRVKKQYFVEIHSKSESQCIVLDKSFEIIKKETVLYDYNRGK